MIAAIVVVVASMAFVDDVRSQLWWSLGSLAVVLGAYFVRLRVGGRPAPRDRAPRFTREEGRHELRLGRGAVLSAALAVRVKLPANSAGFSTQTALRPISPPPYPAGVRGPRTIRGCRMTSNASTG